MSEISMNKVIHAAVRRDLDRFDSALASFPPGDQTRAGDLHRAWQNFDRELTRHHHDEHRIAWPALQAVGVSPSVLADMDAEHDDMAAALAETRAALGTLSGRAGAEEASAALAAVRHLREVTVRHLDHEERELEGVYLAKRDAPEIKAMGREFSKVGPAVGGRFFAWLLDGAGPQERAAVAQSVPKPVLVVIQGVFGRSYRREVAPVWRR